MINVINDHCAVSCMGTVQDIIVFAHFFCRRGVFLTQLC